MKTQQHFIFIILLLIGAGNFTSAQVYLNSTFSTLRCSGIVLDSAGYIVNGWVLGLDTNGFTHRDLVLFRLNEQGQKLDSLIVVNDWNDGFSAFAGSLKRLSNGDLLQVGYIGNDGDSTTSGIVYRIHGDFSDTVWSAIYQYNDINIPINFDAVELPSGNIAVVGQYFHSYNTSIQSYVTRGWLYMLDYQGIRLWEKSINFPSYAAGGTFKDIKLAHDGGFILGAGAYLNSTWNSVDGWVIKTDSLGNEQWRHKMTTGSQWYDSEPIIVPTSDGNYVVGQLVAHGNFYGDLGGIKTTMRFKKLSPLGQVLWHVEYGDTTLTDYPFYNPQGPYIVSHVIFKEGYELSDQSLVFGGTNQAFGALMKLSEQGDSLWYRIFLDRENNWSNLYNIALNEVARLEDFKPLPNGGFICVGQYETVPGPVYPNGAQLNWIVQLDEWGCDSLGCQYISLPELPQPQAGSYAMRIWPNPASNELYVELPAQHMGLLITIRNALGQSVYQAFHSNRPIDISHLAAGVYTVESGLPGHLFGYAKLVKR